MSCIIRGLLYQRPFIFCYIDLKNTVGQSTPHWHLTSMLNYLYTPDYLDLKALMQEQILTALCIFFTVDALNIIENDSGNVAAAKIIHFMR